MAFRPPMLPRSIRSRPSAQAQARPCCLVAALHPERGLGHALAQHLADEMPGIDFVLSDRRGIDALWLCGYERGHGALLRRWRARYPRAILLVTGREPAPLWAGEALAAGADHALAWPVDLDRLARLLRTPRLERA
jgi:hypothetical protein